MSPSPETIVQGQKARQWQDAIDELQGVYRKAERNNLALPPVSLVPFFLYFWNYLKFTFLLVADVYLIVPLNLVVFLRNIFPGKWRYRSFSWRYIKYGIMWIWRGELLIPSIYIRPLTGMLLRMHYRKNFLLLRRHILLDDEIIENERGALIATIDTACRQWKTPRIMAITFTYVLPSATMLIEIYRFFEIGKFLDVGTMPPWSKYIAVTLLSYSLGIFCSCFTAKRGLMLGGTGRGAYFAGGIKENLYYETERKTLGSVGVKSKEMPLDLVVWAIIIVLGIFSLDWMMEWMIDFQVQIACFGVEAQATCFEQVKPGVIRSLEYQMAVLLPVLGLSWVMLGGFVLFRRFKCQRL